MRTIKFKVWNRRTSSWVADGEPMNLNYSIRSNAFMFDNDNYDLGDDMDLVEFTGLLDKNGKEIYEGDICHYVRRNYRAFDADEDRTFEVVWSEARSGWCAGNSSIPVAHFTKNYIEHSEIVVIGNVWENPELLKGE